MYRTWMFIPGSQDKYLEKTQDLSADVFIFDLEDAVSIADKKIARDKVKKCMQNLANRLNFVRVNPLSSPYMLEDLQQIMNSKLTGIMIPRTTGREDVIIVDYILEQLEIKHGIERKSLSIIPLIETAEGLHNSYEIASASERVYCLSFGAEDFMLDLNIESTEGEQELLYARSKLVTVSKVAVKGRPIDSVFTDFTDNNGLKESATKAKKLGFQGKLIVHPNQIEAVNQVFTPTSEQIIQARKIVEKFDRTEEVVIQVDGKMVDYPVVEQARQILSYLEK